MIQKIIYGSLVLAIMVGIITCSKNVNYESVSEVDQLASSSSVMTNKEDYLNEDFNLLVKQYEDPNRENWQNPELILGKLQPLKDMTVADIGVGTGFFTFRIVREAEKVIAIDIENRFLEYIEERKYELKDSEVTKKIETRLCLKDDPHLLEKEVDIALMVNTYHFIEDRVGYMLKVRDGLIDKGRITIVDYKSGVIPIGPPESMKVPLETTLTELEKAGFVISEVDTSSLEFQYIVSGFTNK